MNEPPSAPLTVNAFTHPDARCDCVADHNPNVITFHRHHILPLGMGGADEPSNTVLLCPTVHYAVHHLLREWVKTGGEPVWEIRRRFGPYARGLAEEGWDRWVDAGTPEAATALRAAGWLA